MAKIDPVKLLEPWELGSWEQQHHSRPTAITTKVGPRIVHAGGLLPDGKKAKADTSVFAVVVNVDAAVNGWQPSPLMLAAGETASITASGQWVVVGPNWNGADGHAGIPAYGPAPNPHPGSQWMGGGYILPGAVEGCLLVQDGTGYVQAFGPPGLGSDPVIVHAPGRISFIANDELVPQQGIQHAGYADNTGSLTVTMQFSALALEESTLLAMTVCRLLGKDVSLLDIIEAGGQNSPLSDSVKAGEYLEMLGKSSK